MKIAYFDTFAGIAGDMVLGAFVSAGLDSNKIMEELSKLNLGEVQLRVSSVVRSGINASKVEVVVSGQVERVNDLGREINTRVHVREENHSNGGHGRSYHDIKRLIEDSGLSSFVKSKALSVFLKLAEAEAKIHNTDVDKIHFHEVGAFDSIVDIVGAAICLELSNIESVFTSPIRLGSAGYIEAKHGVLPVPAPATVEILKGYPVVFNDVPFELTTPTGAALVAALSKGVLRESPIKVERIGYGAGTRDLGRLPNLLRIVIGESDNEKEEDYVILLETNMDDINPQLVPYVIEKVLALGATDAYVSPVIMKKGRPGFELTVLTREPLLDRISSEIFSQTTTLGMRIQKVRRIKASRESKLMQTTFGEVRVKISEIGGQRRFNVEFEDCKSIADSRNFSLFDVMQKINSELNRE